MKKAFFGLLSLTLLVGTACKKSKDAPAYTKENVAGSYTLLKVTFKSSMGGGEQDITSAYIDDCVKDDIITLKADGSYESKDAGEPCLGDYTGTWDIPDATKFKRDQDIFTLHSWDGSTLAVSEAWQMPGVDGTAILYFKK